MTDDLIERLRAGVPNAVGGTGYFVADESLADHLLAEAADRIATQQEAIGEMVAHIREQSTHCQTRIQDGIEMGATIWRLALEDVVRENAALLSKHGERT